VSRLQRLTEARELLERAEQLNPMHPEVSSTTRASWWSTASRAKHSSARNAQSRAAPTVARRPTCSVKSKSS
jgi:hypothetical protein